LASFVSVREYIVWRNVPDPDATIGRTGSEKLSSSGKGQCEYHREVTLTSGIFFAGKNVKQQDSSIRESSSKEMAVR
jgi:hypothetical protein